MKVSRRETVLGLSTLAAALLGGTIMLARPRLDEWQDAVKEQDEVLLRIAGHERLLETREQWAQQYVGLRASIPQQPPDTKNMDIYWLAIMDNLASKHGVAIKKRQAGEEKRVGDVYELPVECKEFESSLVALRDFLIDLQTEGAMLDMRQLFVKPTQEKTLRGRFTLYCAYTRERKADAGEAGERKTPSAPAAPPPAPEK